MANNTGNRTQELLHDLQGIQYLPPAKPRAERREEIAVALEACIQAFSNAGASPEFLSQLRKMKGL